MGSEMCIRDRVKGGEENEQNQYDYFAPFVVSISFAEKSFQRDVDLGKIKKVAENGFPILCRICYLR